MKTGKKSLVLLLIFAMAVSLFPQRAYAAKKKVKLNKKSVTVNVGKSVKIKLKNNKKKVKWTVISGKKNVTLSKKSKTGVTIKGKKAGKAKVQAKIGRKKYVCKVTIKKKQSTKKTVKPTPTRKPSASIATPTRKPSAPIATPTVKPTQEPVQTMQPADQTPQMLTKQGLYAENDDLLISSVKFDKQVDYYALGQNTIFVAMPDGKIEKEAMPDAKKCEYTVYSHGKKAVVKSISDPVWHDESYYKDNTDDGYYTFKMTIEQGGKQYSADVNLVSYTETIEYYQVDNGLVFRTLIVDGKEYELERSLECRKDEVNCDYYFKSEDVSFDDLVDAQEYKAVVRYEDKEYTLECEVGEFDLDEYADIRFFHPTLQIGDLWIGSPSDYFMMNKKSDKSFSILTYTSTKGDVKFYPENNLFEYQGGIDEEKSLKDIFTELDKDLQIIQTACGNESYTNAAIENVVWHKEAYYSDESDNGYYSFDVSITENDKKIKQSYWLVEKQKRYTVSGTLKTADGKPIADSYLWVLKDGQDYNFVYTNAKGEYSLEASNGTYSFLVGDSFTVNKSPLKLDMTLPVYELTGSITREGAPAVDAGFWIKADGDYTVLYSGMIDKGHYRAYVEKGIYELKQGNQVLDTFEATGSGTKDFVVALYRLTGKFEKNMIEFVDVNDDQNDVYSSTYNKTYRVFLKPGVYNVIYKNIVFDTIEVTSQDLEKDFLVTSCKGKILDIDGNEFPEMAWSDVNIKVEKDGSYFNSVLLRSYLQKKGSGYEIVLPKGTYEFFYGTTSLGSVTIKDENVEKDLYLPFRYVKFHLLDKQNNVIMPKSRIDVLNTDDNQWYGYSPDNGEGMYLSLGNYEVQQVSGLSYKGYEFSVAKDTDLVEIQTETYQVSGSCQIVGKESGQYVIILLGENMQLTTYAEDGKYEFYLKPGEYNLMIIYKSEEDPNGHSIVDEKITISDSSVKKNYDINVGQFSGQLTWKDGTNAMRDENSLNLYSEELGIVDIYADLGADGSFSFSNVPYGTYLLRLNETEVATITINSPDKQQDYIIDGYQIAATVKDANGEFVKDKWVYFGSGEKSYYAYIDNDKGLALAVVGKPGTYTVYGFTNDGNQIHYGTVTVTDKNVVCELSELE